MVFTDSDFSVLLNFSYLGYSFIRLFQTARSIVKTDRQTNRQKQRLTYNSEDAYRPTLLFIIGSTCML